MLIEWGDTSPLALESDTVRNLWGASQMPGTKKVWNRKTNKLEDCNPMLCPYAQDGINHTPFGAFGDVSRKSKSFEFWSPKGTPLPGTLAGL